MKRLLVAIMLSSLAACAVRAEDPVDFADARLKAVVEDTLWVVDPTPTDMLGLTTGFNPKYLKRYADLHEAASAAARAYVQEVRDGTYPDAEHSHE